MRQPALARAAQRDITEAHRWYAARSAATAQRFLDELRAVVETIGNTPELFPVLQSGVRRARLRTFPFWVYYRVRGSYVRVVAVIHHRRDQAL